MAKFTHAGGSPRLHWSLKKQRVAADVYLFLQMHTPSAKPYAINFTFFSFSELLFFFLKMCEQQNRIKQNKTALASIEEKHFFPQNNIVATITLL